MTLITFGSQINGGLNKRGDRALGKIKWAGGGGPNKWEGGF